MGLHVGAALVKQFGVTKGDRVLHVVQVRVSIHELVYGKWFARVSSCVNYNLVHIYLLVIVEVVSFNKILRNYPEWIVAFIAATSIGAVAVPVSFFRWYIYIYVGNCGYIL